MNAANMMATLRRNIGLATVGLGVTLLLAAAAPSARTEEPQARRDAPMMKTDGWPKASQDAIADMTKKYGPPAAVTADAAIWGKAGPWKRTIVFREEYPHDFPMAHTDVMQQWLDYKAAPDKYDELAMYDGSVVLERTSGEMSARCDKEAANFLALNLAHDIVTGKRTVADARSFYGEQIMAMKAMQPAPYTEKLLFSAMSHTADRDCPLDPNMKK